MSKDVEQPRTIPADRRLRAIVVAGAVASTVIGAAVILWVLPLGHRYLERQQPRVVLRVVQAVIAVLFLSIVPLALYLYYFGRRAVRHRQIPPPGTRVIVNTEAITGDRAVRRARIVMTLAVILAALGLLGGLGFPYWLERVFGGRLTTPSADSVQQPERAEGSEHKTTP